MLLPLPVGSSQAQKYAPVRHLMLYLTEECNLRCSYCFVKKEPRFMTREVALRTLDYLMQRNISGGFYELCVTFFGGEPFLAVERMQEVIDYAAQSRPNVDKGFRFAATTNGTLAHARVEKVIRDGSMDLLVSLDGGPEASRLRPMVSGRESYAMVAKNLPKLAAWASRCSLRMTYTPKQLDLVARVRQALCLAPLGVALCPVVEADWSGHEQALEAAFQELGDWFLQEFSQGRRPPLEITWELLRAYSTRLHCQSRPQRPCPVGDSLLAVDSQGQVLPCHRFLPLAGRLGTVVDENLPLERWRYVHLQRAEIPDCPTCEARTVCGGGCRAVALQAGYGLQGVHPNHCLLMRTHMRQVQRLYQQLHWQPRFWNELPPESASSNLLRELATLGS